MWNLFKYIPCQVKGVNCSLKTHDRTQPAFLLVRKGRWGPLSPSMETALTKAMGDQGYLAGYPIFRFSRII